MKPAFFLSLIVLAFSNCTAFAQIYTYNNAQDTIVLTPVSNQQFCFCGLVEVVDSIQINGVGSDELLFHRTCSLNIRKHGGMFDIVEDGYISKYEIWDLDAKECLFEAVNSYHSDFSRSHGYFDQEWPAKGSGSESYSYQFAIDSLGTIVISNFTSALYKDGHEQSQDLQLSTTRLLTEGTLTPDKLEGTYTYDKTIRGYVAE